MHVFSSWWTVPLLTVAPWLPARAGAARPGAHGPIAKIRQSIICCPRDSVTIDGWASIDVGGEVAEWQWDLNGDGKVDRTTTMGEVGFMAPAEPRTLIVVLRVKGSEGSLSSPDSAMVCVMNSQPQVVMEADTSIKIGTRVSFNPKATVPCGSIARYEWDLDDDGVFEYQSRTDGRTSKAYFKPGRYRARLRVTDTMGHEGGGVRYIMVTRQLPHQ